MVLGDVGSEISSVYLFSETDACVIGKYYSKGLEHCAITTRTQNKALFKVNSKDDQGQKFLTLENVCVIVYGTELCSFRCF